MQEQPSAANQINSFVLETEGRILHWQQNIIKIITYQPSTLCHVWWSHAKWPVHYSSKDDQVCWRDL